MKNKNEERREIRSRWKNYKKNWDGLVGKLNRNRNRNKIIYETEE